MFVVKSKILQEAHCNKTLLFQLTKRLSPYTFVVISNLNSFGEMNKQKLPDDLYRNRLR